jgi:predicted nucleic acid-binding protein
VSYLIDTNVLSELRRKSPDPSVARWFADRPAGTLYLSVLTLGELRKGVERLTEPARRLALLDWLETELPAFFAGRLLAVDAAVADRWGYLQATWPSSACRCSTLGLGSAFCATSALLGHILLKHPVHARLPAFAGVAEVAQDFGAIPDGDQELLVLRFRPPANGLDGHHGLQLFGCERLRVRVSLSCTPDLPVLRLGRHGNDALRRSFRHSA